MNHKIVRAAIVDIVNDLEYTPEIIFARRGRYCLLGKHPYCRGYKFTHDRVMKLIEMFGTGELVTCKDDSGTVTSRQYVWERR